MTDSEAPEGDAISDEGLRERVKDAIDSVLEWREMGMITCCREAEACDVCPRRTNWPEMDYDELADAVFAATQLLETRARAAVLEAERDFARERELKAKGEQMVLASKLAKAEAVIAAARGLLTAGKVRGWLNEIEAALRDYDATTPPTEEGNGD